MPNLNGAKYLSRSIESFLAQDYINKELIIVDGKSTDDSHNIISKYISLFSSIVWLKVDEIGIADSFNQGVEIAKGDLIGYLGSDDLLYENIFKVINYNNSIFKFDAIYFNCYVYYILEGKADYRRPLGNFIVEDIFKYKSIVPWQDIFYRKEIYAEHKVERLNKFSMDIEFFLRVAKKNLFYLFVDKVATINIQDGNITTSMSDKQNKEIDEIVKKYYPLYYSGEDKSGMNKYLIYQPQNMSIFAQIKSKIKAVLKSILFRAA